MKFRYSQPDTTALTEEIIKRYNFTEPVTCILHRKGMSDVYKVTVGDTVYYLKNYLTGIHDLIDYEDEMVIINSLNENGVSTAIPVVCADGNLVWSITAPEGIRYAVLFTEAINTPVKDNLKNAYNFGRAIAEMHAIADEKEYKISRAPIDFVQLIDDPLEKLRPFTNDDDFKFVSEAMENLRKFIADRLPMEKPYYGFCHGDLQLSNVCFNGETPTFFDFDTMGYGWRAHDVSVHIFNTEEFVNQKFRESEEYTAFIDGYNSIRPLTDAEMECIDAFGAIRAIWALAINIKLLASHGYFSINQLVNILVGVFKTWYQKTTERKLS